MDKEFLINNQKIILIIDLPFENCKSDIVLNWVYVDPRHGPEPFYKFMEKAGGQVRSLLVFFDSHLKYSDNISTIPGLIECNLIVHSVVPHTTAMYNDNFLRIKRTLEKYKVENLCRSISLYIPVVSQRRVIVDYMLEHFQQIPELEKIEIYTKDEEEFYDLKFHLEKVRRNTVIKKVWNFTSNYIKWKKKI